MFVEHRQIVVGMAGHANQVTRGQQCSAAGHRPPRPCGKLLQRGRHDDRHRQSVVHPEFRITQLAADQCIQRVVAAPRPLMPYAAGWSRQREQ